MLNLGVAHFRRMWQAKNAARWLFLASNSPAKTQAKSMSLRIRLFSGPESAYICV
jgi:hypothetical protein